MQSAFSLKVEACHGSITDYYHNCNKYVLKFILHVFIHLYLSVPFDFMLGIPGSSLLRTSINKITSYHVGALGIK